MPLVRIHIDQLTNSIRNVSSGDIFDTELIRLSGDNRAEIKKSNWLFDWQAEVLKKDRWTFKLVIENNPKILQGLVSISDQKDHIYLHLVENAKFNRGKNRVYEGVAGNLFAFACKRSFEAGYEGYVAFDAKTSLLKHYEQSLGATHFRGTRMFLDDAAAIKLVNQYFKK
ncbi:MAG: hypothetical protein ACKVUS_00645 [Saprospiraceae bacterium]